MPCTRECNGYAVQVVDWGPDTVEVDVDAPQVLSQGKLRNK